MTFAELCPSVTVECGTSGETGSTGHALDFIQRCLQLDTISDHAIGSRDFDLYHTVAVVKIPSAINFGFDGSDHDLILEHTVEDWNFHEVPEGTVLGRVREGVEQVLDIRDEQGSEATKQYFAIEDGRLVTRRTIVPAMITVNTDIIRKDCFCYLMERYPLPGL